LNIEFIEQGEAPLNRGHEGRQASPWKGKEKDSRISGKVGKGMPGGSEPRGGKARARLIVSRPGGSGYWRLERQPWTEFVSSAPSGGERGAGTSPSRRRGRGARTRSTNPYRESRSLAPPRACCASRVLLILAWKYRRDPESRRRRRRPHRSDNKGRRCTEEAHRESRRRIVLPPSDRPSHWPSHRPPIGHRP
jgi:hypothetical protein